MNQDLVLLLNNIAMALLPSVSSAQQTGNLSSIQSQAHATTVNHNSSIDLQNCNSCQPLWILDTGGIDHICNSLDLFTSFYIFESVLVSLLNGYQVTSCYKGTVYISNDLIFFDVLYFRNFQHNLISIIKLIADLNCFSTFSQHSSSIQALSVLKKIGDAEVEGGLYILKTTFDFTPAIHHTVTVESTINNTHSHTSIWHLRLGHLSLDRLKIMNKRFPFVSVDMAAICDVCHFSKQKQLPFPCSFTHSNNILDLVHMDIWGLALVPSMLGYKYFLTVVDDYSRFTWIYLMKSKSETSSLVKNFFFRVEN